MPQFVLDTGSPEAEKTYDDLDSFTQGYVQCLFFTEEAPGTTAETWDREVEGSFPGDMNFGDLAPSALRGIIADCTKFQADNAEALAIAYDCTADGLAYSEERAGHDFWLNRNGHGAGFWGRDFRGDDGTKNATIGDTLSVACKTCGTADVYLGDDNKIYIMGWEGSE